jgi:hypothetical protein
MAPQDCAGIDKPNVVRGGMRRLGAHGKIVGTSGGIGAVK